MKNYKEIFKVFLKEEKIYEIFCAMVEDNNWNNIEDYCADFPPKFWILYFQEDWIKYASERELEDSFWLDKGVLWAKKLNE